MLQLSSTVELKLHRSDLRSDVTFSESILGDGVYFTAGQSYLKLKKFPYPQIITEISTSAKNFGYDFGNGEVFSIEVISGKCFVRTPGFGQVQLFYLCSDEWLLAADSFAGLVSMVQPLYQLELDPDGVIDWLLLQPNLAQQTIIKYIYKLPENSQLQWSGGSWDVAAVQSLEEQVIPFASLNTAHMQTEFEEHLHTQISTVASISQSNSWSSCLSGGVDSAVVTTLVSQVLPTQALAISAEPAAVRVQQQAVLQSLVQKLPVSLGHVSAAEIPLLEDLDELLLADPYLDPYANWSIALAQHCHVLHNKVVFTGIGGDDFYARHQTATPAQHSADMLSSRFIASRFTARTKQQLAKTSILPASLSDALLFYHVPWMLCGVWPVSPFASAGSISFSLYLKNAHKQKKQFLQDFIQAKTGLTFPQWQHKFSLSPVFYAAVIAITPSFSCANLHQALRNLAIFEYEEIETVLQQIREHHQVNKQDMRQLFQLYKLNRFLQILDL